MKVITLDEESLDLHCKRLASQIRASEFNPQLILGVETGGAIIASMIHKYCNDSNCKLEFCHPVRNISVTKKNNLKKLLHYLPLFLNNFLRKLEFKFLFNQKKRTIFIQIDIPDNLQDFNKILIIDDAIDSGATMQQLVGKIKKIHPSIDIKTAVLTVTSSNPSFYPDFYIYNDSTLLRFPWSIDAKS